MKHDFRSDIKHFQVTNMYPPQPYLLPLATDIFWGKLVSFVEAEHFNATILFSNQQVEMKRRCPTIQLKSRAIQSFPGHQ